MQKLIVTLALGAAMISTPALAQDGSRGGAFMQRDQTRAEAQQRADTMFQMLDSNKDGTVTKAEADEALAQFQAARGDDDNGGRGAGRMQRMIDQAFGTAQSLTKAQFETLSLARFDAADLNHDGTVTVAERQQLRAQRQAARGGAAAPATQAAPAKPQ
jgi:Ca2+-binding EF-hand superfamily protein